ncbi:ATP-binding protein [Amycolatopsis sp. 3B14]|uniref:ATP-binding protein n=1 Tax=Amycolatopsis sp. 3B14 TaxID=3243600 RepID=UPI003D95D10B
MPKPSHPEERERTLNMSVANTGFMVDRLGQDCAPLQFLRELTQNSIEAILATPSRAGDIIWDVDWTHYDLTGVYKLCVVDTGVGMSGEDMVRYINALSSSVHEQSHDGNFGVGAKIAAATRNHEGLIYLSWKSGARGAMIHLWRDPATQNYGLRQLPTGRSFQHWASIEDSARPTEVEAHGTKVTLLGNSAEANTMAAPAGSQSPSRWIGRYLNTRYFRFPAGITVRAREGWENPRTDHDRNLLRRITGQEQYLTQHADKHGTVDLDGATVRWWILKEEPALTQNSGFVASSGHVAALYRDELYEMTQGRAAVARLQNFGIIFGYRQVVLYIEPHTSDSRWITSNTARTQLLLNSEPLPWAEWSAEFRSKLPSDIREHMENITAGANVTDHRKAIKDRLREIRDLFKFSRYKSAGSGEKNAVFDDLTTGGDRGTRGETKRGGGGRPGGSGGRAGNIYSLFLSDAGDPADEIGGSDDPTVQWVTVADGTRDVGFLEDRAAKYLSDQNLLQINGDFRGFTDMIDRWCEMYEHVPGARPEIVEVCREWFEQALTETILGIKSLIGSREWTTDDIATCWREEALTAAVMQRYHIDVAVKRALGSKLGSLRERTP